MINYLSQEVVSKFTVGTAVSGLTMIVLRTLVTALFGVATAQSKSILVYFITGIAVISVDTVANLRFCRSDVYHQLIEPFLANKRIASKESISRLVNDKEQTHSKENGE